METQIGEREKKTFLSQSVATPNDPKSTPSSSAPINAIHISWSRKQVDNQVVMPDQTNYSHPMSIPSSSGSYKSEEKEAEQVTELPYEPPASFPNRLRSKKHTAQMKKNLEIF